MLDQAARRVVAVPLDRLARGLDIRGVSPIRLTVVGWLVGLGACGAVATQQWAWAIALWLLNRLLDGLDGALARRRGPTDLGGFLDLLADFSIYAGFVFALGVAEPDARLAVAALLVAYYLNGVAFLALSSSIERRRAADLADGRSYRFSRGLTEGTETIVAYVVFCVFPDHIETIAWTFAALVAVTAVQRTMTAVVLLRDDPVAIGEETP